MRTVSKRVSQVAGSTSSAGGLGPPHTAHGIRLPLHLHTAAVGHRLYAQRRAVAQAQEVCLQRVVAARGGGLLGAEGWGVERRGEMRGGDG